MGRGKRGRGERASRPREELRPKRPRKDTYSVGERARCLEEVKKQTIEFGVKHGVWQKKQLIHNLGELNQQLGSVRREVEPLGRMLSATYQSQVFLWNWKKYNAFPFYFDSAHYFWSSLSI